MFITIPRKPLKVLIPLVLLTICISLLNTSSRLVDETNRIIKNKLSSINHFDILSTKLFSNKQDDTEDDLNNQIDIANPKSIFNKQVDEIFNKKLNSDIENKYWLVDTDITNENTELNIPKYYLDFSIENPDLQPFDPRFTLGMYYYYIQKEYRKNPNKIVEAPFHWYDWVDMSSLNKYLLASTLEKPDCSILDSRIQEIEMNEDNKKNNEALLKDLKNQYDAKYGNLLGGNEKVTPVKEDLKEDAKPENKQETKPESTDSNTENNTESKDEAKPENTDSNTESNTENKDEAKPESTDSNTESNTENKDEAKPENTENKDETKPESTDSNTENKDETKPESTDSNTENKDEAKPESKDEAKPESNESNTENKDENKDEAKPESNESNTENKDENKDEAKPEGDENKGESAESNTENNENNDTEAKVENTGENKKEKRLDALNNKEYCIEDTDLPYKHDDGNKLHPGFNVFKPVGKTNNEKGSLAGKSYLYSFAPPPSTIIFLTQDGSYNITTKSKKSKLLNNGIVESYIHDTKKTKINSLEVFENLQKNVPADKKNVMNDYEITIPEQNFEVNFNDVIKDLETKIRSGKKLSKNHLSYLNSLKYSIDRVNNGGPPKYFSEARLLDSLLGDHYDWRFFNGIMYGTYEQTLTLHRLVRTFLSFCRKNGITTWVAHGSLLSWYWNGIAFPWDNDIDVQVPLADLHKLSMNFNQSLIVEDFQDGFGRYFLDCGSFITLRERGNGNNNIDARFIDVDTGLYIDITGLAISNSNAPDRYQYPPNHQKDEQDHIKNNRALKVYNCRNNHFSSLNELSPMVKTFIEGEMGYIPKRYTDILAVEYPKGLLTKTFSGHIFVPQLRLWISERDLYYFLNDKSKWLRYNNYNEEYSQAISNEDSDNDVNFEDLNYELTNDQKDKLKSEAEKNQAKNLKDDDLLTIWKFSHEELLELLSKDELLMSYFSTRGMTSLHETEIQNLLFGKSSKPLIEKAPDFKPLLYDPFLFKVKSDYIDYDDEVDTYSDLLEAYQYNEQKNKENLLKASGKIINPDEVENYDQLVNDDKAHSGAGTIKVEQSS